MADVPQDRPGAGDTRGPEDPQEAQEAQELPEGAAFFDEPDHEDDGLDLARAIARAAGSGPAPATGVRRRPGTGPTGTGRGAAGGRRLRRGDGPVFSGAGPDDRDPQGLERLVDRLVGDRGWEVDLQAHGLFARWADLVGAEIGQHSTPESFVDGKVVVRTTSTAWATQLRLLAPGLVRRLNEELGHGTVTVIEVLGPHGPTWKRGPRSVRDGRGPRDTYG